jgi:hypothetical protein
LIDDNSIFMSAKDLFMLTRERVFLRKRDRVLEAVAQLTGVSPISKSAGRQLVRLGAKVGLSASEVEAAVAKPGAPKPRALPRWAIWAVCIGALAIGLIAGAAWINLVRYTTYGTYLPGSRYGALSPHDFSD